MKRFAGVKQRISQKFLHHYSLDNLKNELIKGFKKECPPENRSDEYDIFITDPNKDEVTIDLDIDLYYDLIVKVEIEIKILLK